MTLHPAVLVTLTADLIGSARDAMVARFRHEHKLDPDVAAFRAMPTCGICGEIMWDEK